MYILLTSFPSPLLQPHFVPFPYLKISDTMSWQKIAEDKKARIAASIPEEWRIKSLPTDDFVMLYPSQSDIMSSEELAITESSAVDLVVELATGKLTSVAVTTAFCKRAAIAHQLVRMPPDQRPNITNLMVE
jgi:amidase